MPLPAVSALMLKTPPLWNGLITFRAAPTRARPVYALPLLSTVMLPDTAGPGAVVTNRSEVPAS